MKILITGGDGYIAKSISKSLVGKYQIDSISRVDFDLRSSRLTDLWFKDKEYDAVIHTAVKGGSRLALDEAATIDDNLKMYNNLSKNSNRFKKLIHFGSGAEVYAGNTPYAISKRMISNLIEKKDNFYNLRIFAVFDENELETRFIKSNVKKYINNQSMQVHSDKQMDFFYMQDLISLIEHYLLNGGDKNTDCCYPYKKTLMQIANFINTLGSHNVLVEARAGWLNNTPPYTGISELPIKTVGLEEGVRRVYKKLYQATTQA